MSVAISELPTRPDFPSTDNRSRVATNGAGWTQPKARESSLVLRILTTSLLVHLLLVGFFGAGVPQPHVRPKRAEVPPTAATLIEDVKLQEEPPAVELKPPAIEDELPPPELPAPSLVEALAVSQVQPIAAVPAAVPVAFGIEVKGNVRLVSDAALASGSVGGRGRNEPVLIDGNSLQEKNLLLPEFTSYPPEAQIRRQQGTVILEFQTTDTGDIQGVKVHTSSGSLFLDRAAMKNLSQGRWLGTAGRFLKAYEFQLK